MDNRCKSGKHCCARTPEGPAATHKRDTLCTACIEDIQRRLDELPLYQEALRSFLGGMPKTSLQSKVHYTPEPAAPYNVRVGDLIDDIGEALSRASVPIRDLINQPPEKFPVWIRDGLTDIYLTGVDRALMVRKVHMQADGVLGFGRQWRKRHAPCPCCGMQTIGGWLGGDALHCTNNKCRIVMNLSDYERYCTGEEFELENPNG